MALGGLGFGLYTAVDLGVMNIAAALPAKVAPALAPAILTVGGSYSVLYAVGGTCAVARVKRIR